MLYQMTFSSHGDYTLIKRYTITTAISFAIVVLCSVLVTGCNEQNIVGDVISGGGEVIEPKPGDPTGPITSVGEVKKPDPKDPPKKEEKPEPEPEPEPAEPVTQEYFRGVAIADILPPSAWVLDFPGPYREYAPPESNPEDFVGQVAMADYVAPVSEALVTITNGPRTGEQVVTDEGGYYLFEDVAGNELHLRVERQYLEPKEVIVSRSRPTALQHLRPNEVFNAAYQEREGLGNAPGVILMGLRWPDAVRFILESEKLPYDLLYRMADQSSDSAWVPGGAYGGLVIRVYPPFKTGVKFITVPLCTNSPMRGNMQLLCYMAMVVGVPGNGATLLRVRPIKWHGKRICKKSRAKIGWERLIRVTITSQIYLRTPPNSVLCTGNWKLEWSERNLWVVGYKKEPPTVSSGARSISPTSMIDYIGS